MTRPFIPTNIGGAIEELYQKTRPDFNLDAEDWVQTKFDAQDARMAQIEADIIKNSLVELPPFTLFGDVRISESGRYYAPVPRKVTQIFASLRVAGTSNTTIEWRWNGVSQQSLTLGSGATLVSAYTDISIDINGRVTVACTAAGVGAKDLVVQSRTTSP